MQADWITPNLDELGALTGQKVALRYEVPEAADRLREIARQGGNDRLNILATGGHLDQPDDYLLTADGEGCWLTGERVDTNATHGTGCALSSALLSRVVLGDLPMPAAARAKEYVSTALRKAYPVGRGKGPMNHLFALDLPPAL